MQTYACFVNSETPPVSVKHIAWAVIPKTIEGVSFLQLHEIVEEKFPHPDAPQYAFVFRLNTYPNKLVKESEAAELLFLKAAQDACSKFNPVTTKTN